MLLTLINLSRTQRCADYRLSLLLSASILLSPAAMAQSKQDLRGFTPGMTFDDAKKLADSSGYKDCSVVPEMILYGIRCSDINATLWFSPALDKRPLVAVVTHLETNATEKAVVESIAAQFGTSFEEERQPNGFLIAYVWKIGADKILRLASRSYEVRLYSPTLWQADKDERFRQSRIPVPKL